MLYIYIFMVYTDIDINHVVSWHQKCADSLIFKKYKYACDGVIYITQASIKCMQSFSYNGKIEVDLGYSQIAEYCRVVFLVSRHFGKGHFGNWTFQE